MGNYGNLIKKLRIEHGNTRNMLAEKLGITESGLGKMERGERKISTETIKKVCEIYSTPLSYFFGYSNEIGEWNNVIKTLEEKDISPSEVLSFIQVMEKLRRK